MSFETIWQTISSSYLVHALLVLIVFDTIFGVLRAIKERALNSGIGINGVIRKVGIVLTIVLCYFIDLFIHFDITSFLPNSFSSILPEVGLAEIFGFILIAFEGLSILKNMSLIGLPINKTLQLELEKFLEKMTSEVKK